ncbi:MAG: orotidine-5'-phosphate decarboxylase [Bdellovibrionales bacterium CG12_big_fil_rev_8_21_14_0_65_38_15]|nr:MAG: orotidine-5'-phosphate decarboxylase [Bdellovibrionales bacterium CG22_combo_CG10-13_8_21_14_all_38_13]PIQ55241.1 MAG: orotidine-5'-phosphate decarboxylase [Bdellovibrionales bacterium CG12_big_fil_rev_8_21_14_0_65_38_15]PIR30511.1 MAG: orotidine-5'-phosphate decarboxylase [Bdellovibrionales bacterium CG11_big_fil_rev_8_21_14_0_20_38_13]
MSTSKKVFVALDNMTQAQVFELLPKLSAKVGGIKIGLEMYLQFGKDFIMKANEHFEGDIFLDLKLHDIPNTVAKAIHGLSGLPIRFLTIHASGGEAMMSAAVEAAAAAIPQATVLAVTILTSLDDQETASVYQTKRKESFLRLLSLIEKNHKLGLVCSGAELELIKNKDLITMVPGIRFEHEIQSGKTQDQKSVFTPTQAIERGAHFLVMGRSLTQSSNLEESLKLI